MEKDGKVKHRSPYSKIELARRQIGYALKNKVDFSFLLFDVWFSSVENIKFILKHRKHFICTLKSNRKVALSRKDKLQGHWRKLETLQLKENQSCLSWFNFSREKTLCNSSNWILQPIKDYKPSQK